MWTADISPKLLEGEELDNLFKLGASNLINPMRQGETAVAFVDPFISRPPQYALILMRNNSLYRYDLGSNFPIIQTRLDSDFHLWGICTYNEIFGNCTFGFLDFNKNREVVVPSVIKYKKLVYSHGEFAYILRYKRPILDICCADGNDIRRVSSINLGIDDLIEDVIFCPESGSFVAKCIKVDTKGFSLYRLSGDRRRERISTPQCDDILLSYPFVVLINSSEGGIYYTKTDDLDNWKFFDLVSACADADLFIRPDYIQGMARIVADTDDAFILLMNRYQHSMFVRLGKQDKIVDVINDAIYYSLYSPFIDIWGDHITIRHGYEGMSLCYIYNRTQDSVIGVENVRVCELLEDIKNYRVFERPISAARPPQVDMFNAADSSNNSLSEVVYELDIERSVCPDRWDQVAISPDSNVIYIYDRLCFDKSHFLSNGRWFAIKTRETIDHMHPCLFLFDENQTLWFVDNSDFSVIYSIDLKSSLMRASAPFPPIYKSSVIAIRPGGMLLFKRDERMLYEYTCNHDRRFEMKRPLKHVVIQTEYDPVFAWLSPDQDEWAILVGKDEISDGYKICDLIWASEHNTWTTSLEMYGSIRHFVDKEGSIVLVGHNGDNLYISMDHRYTKWKNVSLRGIKWLRYKHIRVVGYARIGSSNYLTFYHDDDDVSCCVVIDEFKPRVLLRFDGPVDVLAVQDHLLFWQKDEEKNMRLLESEFPVEEIALGSKYIFYNPSSNEFVEFPQPGHSVNEKAASAIPSIRIPEEWKKNKGINKISQGKRTTHFKVAPA